MDMFWTSSLPQLRAFTPQQLTITLWSAVRLGQAPRPAWLRACLRLLTQGGMMALCDAQSLALLAAALAELEVSPGQDWWSAFFARSLQLGREQGRQLVGLEEGQKQQGQEQGWEQGQQQEQQQGREQGQQQRQEQEQQLQQGLEQQQGQAQGQHQGQAQGQHQGQGHASVPEPSPSSPAPASPPTSFTGLTYEKLLWSLSVLQQQPPREWMHAYLAASYPRLRMRTSFRVKNLAAMGLALVTLRVRPGRAWCAQFTAAAEAALGLDATAAEPVLQPDATAEFTAAAEVALGLDATAAEPAPRPAATAAEPAVAQGLGTTAAEPALHPDATAAEPAVAQGLGTTAAEPAPLLDAAALGLGATAAEPALEPDTTAEAALGLGAADHGHDAAPNTPHGPPCDPGGDDRGEAGAARRFAPPRARGQAGREVEMEGKRESQGGRGYWVATPATAPPGPDGRAVAARSRVAQEDLVKLLYAVRELAPQAYGHAWRRLEVGELSSLSREVLRLMREGVRVRAWPSGSRWGGAIKYYGGGRRARLQHES